MQLQDQQASGLYSCLFKVMFSLLENANIISYEFIYKLNYNFHL